MTAANGAGHHQYKSGLLRLLPRRPMSETHLWTIWKMLDVPDQVKPYFDYEAYGRDACIHEKRAAMLSKSDHFVEVYHGLQDIPKGIRYSLSRKLSIREQMAVYQGNHRRFLGYRQMQKKTVGIGDGT